VEAAKKSNKELWLNNNNKTNKILSQAIKKNLQIKIFLIKKFNNLKILYQQPQLLLLTIK
jgi:uncharacterized membrane protein